MFWSTASGTARFALKGELKEGQIYTRQSETKGPLSWIVKASYCTVLVVREWRRYRVAVAVADLVVAVRGFFMAVENHR